ncbi:M1 family metallopeptidase [Pedobacter mucosus]|uniref:M1 family metallopeptidase n=1 Tax=Pedobacter mucosus TaxID=2895286 RepID=UPI001EE48880|nr:M1 family metallopeptidase [Pedobacter mucosus]UKT64968.1 M1 family metallopeptidase [Pedobacter mucosus]
MIKNLRTTFIALVTSITAASAQQAPLALRKSIETSKRSIRLDVPMTNSIKKAFASGTRDFSGKPGPNYWQLEADYNINASLDPEKETITGSEKISMHNNSKDDLKTIVLRLDHNIFRPEAQRGSSVPAEATDGMVLTSLKIAGQLVDLTAVAPFAARGNQNQPAATPTKMTVSGLTQTIATINLVDPIKAGTTVEVEVAWHTKLPGGTIGRGHRMTQRFDNKLFQPTQWYPRLAKYDDLRGWETSPYLGPSEFYNNFGKFDVYLTVPGGWIVSGTGVLQNPKEVLTETARQRLSTVLSSDADVIIVGETEKGAGKATAAGEKLTWHFLADKVNDFAWATADNFIWKATRAIIPGKGPIPIHMVYAPERAKSFERAGQVSRHALEFYSKLWAPYPFPQFTMQDGPSAGMEYPMVINSNQGAADHETAHQWWPMVVGNNETRYGWMDEGFNQYMNILSGADTRSKPYSLDGLGQSYGRNSGSESEAPMMWSANDAGSGYSFQTYGKTPLMLSMLGGIVGDEAVINAMKKYTATWSFKHPSPWDYMFFMDNELGQDLEWFWYYWLFTTETVEGSIQDAKTIKGKTTVKVHQAGQMPSPIVLKVEFEATGPSIKKVSNAKMIDAATAEVTWPASVWFNGNRTFNAVLDFGGRKIKKITLDPNGRFPDANIADNVWPKN